MCVVMLSNSQHKSLFGKSEWTMLIYSSASGRCEDGSGLVAGHLDVVETVEVGQECSDVIGLC